MGIPAYKEVKDFILLVFKKIATGQSGIAPEEEAEIRYSLTKLLSQVLPKPLSASFEFSWQFAGVHEQIKQDAEFILASDPAARNLEEVTNIYPGYFAIFCYRMAHLLAGMNIPLIPRMITEYAHRVTGIDIHPDAIIGCPFSIDHGTGVVIGATTIIGKNVKMYQGVTLGALSVDKSHAQKKRHPTIEDNVVLYAGCTILGGETTIGKNSIIGGNVWLTASVEPDSVVYHKGEVIVRNQGNSQSPSNFVI